MKSAVSRYGFINAKLRARISRILPDDFRESLIQASTLEEVFQILENTDYSGLSRVYDRTGDLQAVEAELFSSQILQYTGILKHTQDEVAGFIKAMTVKLEIENLKNLLRLWFGSRVKKRPMGHRTGYIYREKILHPVGWDALINALTFTDILEGLAGTPYHAVLEPYRLTPVEEGGIFRIETSLDRFYYQFLINQAEKLPPRDRDLVLRILETEVDLQNLSWILRYSRFYRLNAEELAATLLPGGHRFTLQELQPFVSREGGSQEVDPGTLLIHRYPALGALGEAGSSRGSQAARAVLFEKLLEVTRLQEFMKLITGYPFTIGIVLVYFFLKEREIRFLVGVMNGKNYHWQEDKIRESIV